MIVYIGNNHMLQYTVPGLHHYEWDLSERVISVSSLGGGQVGYWLFLGREVSRR